MNNLVKEPTCFKSATNPSTIDVIITNTNNVKNMHLHRDLNPGPWNTIPMLWPISYMYEDAQ